MQLFLLIAGLTLVSAKSIYEPINNNYHETIGIPLAARIKQAEAALDFDGSRIVGGTQTDISVHPHIVGVLTTLVDGRTSSCGGSLLSNNRVITAAHCWQDRNIQGRSMVVVLGSSTLFSGGTRVNAQNVAAHGSYNPNNLNNDVAVVSIPWVNYNNNIRNIQLPTGLLLSMTYAGERAFAAGYGRTVDAPAVDPNGGRLRHVTLYVIENFECANIYGTSNVVHSTLCTAGRGGVGICDGDSGGPLFFTFQNVRYLIGVSSFSAGAGCRASLPSGFARVTSFASWIRARL